MKNPKVSILMSVYNNETYLREAIDSILDQTFKDFEFLIIDDGSNDNSVDIIRSYIDPRIRFVKNKDNIGLTRSLNKGLKLAKGIYIARQDADDISSPKRLEKQAQLLDLHRNVGLISSSIQKIDQNGKELGIRKVFTRDKTIKQNLLKCLNEFVHPCSMFRKTCVEKVGGYREAFVFAQDYDLWLRIAEEFDVANLEEPLCKYRIRCDASSIKYIEEQQFSHRMAHALAVQRQIFGQDDLGYKPQGELFRFLRHEISKSNISRRKILSKRYFICAQNYAFIMGRRSFILTLKYCLRSIINNPLNLTAWNYIACVLFKQLQKRIKIRKSYGKG